VFTYLQRRKLYPGRKAALAERRALDDRFLLALREGPEGFDALKRFLEKQGALEVRVWSVRA
jgi:hypothetical protein